jgi:hypothetical protein
MPDTLKEVEKRECDYWRSLGGRPTEGDWKQNDISREKIQALKNEYGTCFVGSVNFYGSQRANIDNEEIMVEYTGQMVYNFEYAFAVPVKDNTLTGLIRDYNRPTGEPFNSSVQLGKIRAIMDRLYELGGVNLFWV